MESNVKYFEFIQIDILPFNTLNDKEFANILFSCIADNKLPNERLMIYTKYKFKSLFI